MSPILAATLLLMLQTTASSPTLAPMSAASPTNDPAALQAIKRGQLLYAYDQAAWHGTDDFLAHHRDLIPKRGGYIVDGPVEAPRLTFFDADTQRALYSANVVDGRVSDVVVRSGDSAELSPLDHRLIVARTAAAAAITADPTARPCAEKPFNTVVVPPESADGPISVYFLTPQTTKAAVPLGGHFRIDVDAAGKAGPVQRYTHACLNTLVNGAPTGGKQTAVVVSQLIGNRPTEIHVFTSLLLRQPVYVITESGTLPAMWIVVGRRILGPRPLPRRTP